MRAFVRRSFDVLATIDGRYRGVVFFGVLLVYTVALVYESLSYSAPARLFPLVVGVPLAILIVVKVVLLLLGDRFNLQLGGLFSDFEGFEEYRPTVDRAVRYRREFTMVLWVGALIGLIWLVGNLVAIILFIFAFIYVYEGDVVRAAVATVLTFGFIYVLFVWILDASLWRGVVRLW